MARIPRCYMLSQVVGIAETTLARAAPIVGGGSPTPFWCFGHLQKRSIQRIKPDIRGEAL